MNPAFGRSVAQRRHDAGLTQEDLARKTGMTLSFIQKIEAGRTWPRIDNAARVAQVLGCTLDALLEDVEIEIATRT
jgi:transcriptional regulator with XRE-family HTH domain